jgi:hypothetical protein
MSMAAFAPKGRQWMDVTAHQTVAIARAEAEKMQAAVAGTGPDAKVTMSSDQFATVSRLITQLCDLANGPPGNLGDARYWVPLDVFVRVRDKATRLQRDCDELRAGHSDITLLAGGFDGA